MKISNDLFNPVVATTVDRRLGSFLTIASRPSGDKKTRPSAGLFFSRGSVRLNLSCLSTVQENAADKRHAGRDEPFATPGLDRLPIDERVGRIDETGCHSCTHAGNAENEANHCSDAQPETAAKLGEIRCAPETLLFTRNENLTLSPSAHPAERGIHDELCAAVAAKVVTDARLNFSDCRVRRAAPVASWAVSVPMLVIQHWLPVRAFSSQRVGTHREIPNIVTRT